MNARSPRPYDRAQTHVVPQGASERERAGGERFYTRSPHQPRRVFISFQVRRRSHWSASVGD